MLPDGWDSAGKRVLDFRPTGLPPLPLESASFDLVHSARAFTRIGDRWAAWALELHRLLAPGGLLVVGVLPPRALGTLLGEAWDDALVGNLSAGGAAAPDEPDEPLSFVSRWWLRAHWGRAFAVLDFAAAADAAELDLVLMRRREVTLDVADLVAPEPGEPRELAAASYRAETLGRELARARTAAAGRLTALAQDRDERAGEAIYLRSVAERWEEYGEWLAAQLEGLRGALETSEQQARDAVAVADVARGEAGAFAAREAQAQAQAAAAHHELDTATATIQRLSAALAVVYSSRSWRVTAPLRMGGRAARGRPTRRGPVDG